MTNPRSVWIVVLNWNGLADTLACLQSLQQLHYPERRIVVVDNGSTDGSVDALRSARSNSGFELIEAGRNLGYAGGNNLGIRHALEHGAELVWILNNDTTVASDALDLLVEATLADDRVGIAGSVLYHADEPDRIQAWGGGRIGLLGVARTSSAPADRLDFVNGASMLVRSEVFEEIGLLDEHFFFFMEDADFSRTAARRGWRLAVAEGAAVRHKVGASVNRDAAGRSLVADRHLVRASGVFIGKHSGPLLPLAAPARLAVIALRRVGRREAARVPALTGEFVRGVRSGFGARRP